MSFISFGSGKTIIVIVFYWTDKLIEENIQTCPTGAIDLFLLGGTSLSKIYRCHDLIKLFSQDLIENNFKDKTTIIYEYWSRWIDEHRLKLGKFPKITVFFFLKSHLSWLQGL